LDPRLEAMPLGSPEQLIKGLAPNLESLSNNNGQTGQVILMKRKPLLEGKHNQMNAMNSHLKVLH